MNHTYFWPLLGIAAVAFMAWRLVAARRRNSATRAARDAAVQRTVLQAMQAVGMTEETMARRATLRDTPAHAETAARQAAADKTVSPALAADADSARVKAERVIAAELARRKANLQNAPVATARRATTAASTAVAKTAAQTVILLVDDSKMVRVKTGRLLVAHGFQVVTAVDGLDAIRQLETCQPDLVITDIDMPCMDGYGLTRHLRGQSRTAGVPIVMITSTDETHRHFGLAAGAGLVLGKPYVDDELIAYIRSFRFTLATDPAHEPAHA